VLADGAVIGRIMKAAAAPVGNAVDVDARVRLSRGPHADARLRGDRRPVCAAVQKLAIEFVEFKTAAGEALAISIPGTETPVIRHFHSNSLPRRDLAVAVDSISSLSGV
jgi:hypothetical protein